MEDDGGEDIFQLKKKKEYVSHIIHIREIYIYTESIKTIYTYSLHNQLTNS